MQNGEVVLVGPELEENLSLRYLAAALAKAGHATRIIPFNHEPELPRVLDEVLSSSTPPLLVGLSLAFQWRAQEFLALAMALRERGYQGHITSGGHFATFRAQEILTDFPELDSICRHEAEPVITALAYVLSRGESVSNVPGLSFRDGAECVQSNQTAAAPNLASLPWPDRRGEKTAILGHRVAALVGSRGCYASCAFCCIAAWHKQNPSGERFRHRPVEDVAEEMAFLHKEHRVQVFVFHDDNFFMPREADSLARLNGLADALEARGVRDFVTVVKARPTDVSPQSFRVLKDRLRCVRVYVGIETDSTQGLITLRRGMQSRHNHAAMEVLEELGLFVTFNMLIFDPDTTLASLEENLCFMERYAEHPFNFARTELYAGTPLLERMLAEGRAWGDYLGHSYTIQDPLAERVFQIHSRVFRERNFIPPALAIGLMGTRFDVEMAAMLDAGFFQPVWRGRAKELSRRLGLNSVHHLRRIMEHVRHHANRRADEELTASMQETVRTFDSRLLLEANALSSEIRKTLGVEPCDTPGCCHSRGNHQPHQGNHHVQEC